MTPFRYGLYVARRLAESTLVMACAASLGRSLEQCPGFGFLMMGWSQSALVSWVCPLGLALGAQLVLGPKQKRPVFRKVSGALYVYAGVTVRPSGGCRGGLTLGATGSGKTLSCIYPRLHSLCVNEPGIRRSRHAPSQGETDVRCELLRWEARATTLRRQLGTPAAMQQGLLFEEPPPLANAEASDPRNLEASLREAEEAMRRLRKKLRALAYQRPPWGGVLFGEKGSEARAFASLLASHGRGEDLRVLRVRSHGAAPGPGPVVRLNLLGMATVPADTYAKLIVEAALAAENAEKPDEFFVPQARDKIAWGIRLLRAVNNLARENSPPRLTLTSVLSLLSSVQGYRELMDEIDLLPRPPMSTAAHAELQRARTHLERTYWNQPADQLGGVQSTLYNFLAPFSEPVIAEVFCGTSTFDLDEIELGIVVAVAIPQEMAVQRRYVANILKALCYHIIVRRFDSPPPGEADPSRNIVVIEQDEWQRYAVSADTDADIIREAGGAAYMAAQTQDAIWAKFQGKDRASPIVANLRNRWICQAASDACARESAAYLGDARTEAISRTWGHAGASTTRSSSVRPVLPPAFLRSLPPFEVIFAPAEGPWLYRHGIAMPVTPEGNIPSWWFGSWNPWHWLAVGLGLQEKLGVAKHLNREALIPPWRARAPLRAQLRWLVGLDGTWISLRSAARGNARPAAA